jgi:hypothetical protein
MPFGDSPGSCVLEDALPEPRRVPPPGYAEFLVWLWPALLVACSATTELHEPGGSSTESLIHGSDGRLEAYDVTDPLLRARLANSSVALVPNAWLSPGGLAQSLPSWGSQAPPLCEGERFSEQPVVAFCSGILVDWDLVLAAGHCARALALDDFSVVFDYFYAAPGELGLRADSVARPVAIAAEALDSAGTEPRLDYAWFRLARPVLPPREPVPIRRLPPPLELGDRLVTIGSPHGLPLKVDTGSVHDVRNFDDYFIADTDTSRGWSGGGALDETLALVGILARGGIDLTLTEAGCVEERRVGESEPIDEHFTYAHTALNALCAKDDRWSVCRPDCDEPCQAAPRKPDEPTPESAGCSVGSTRASGAPALSFGLLLALSRLRSWLRSRSANTCLGGDS